MLNKLFLILFIATFLLFCNQYVAVTTTNTIPKQDCVDGNKEFNWEKYNNARIEYKEQERSFYANCVDSTDSDIFCVDMEKTLWDTEFRMLQRYTIHYNTCPLGH